MISESLLASILSKSRDYKRKARTKASQNAHQFNPGLFPLKFHGSVNPPITPLPIPAYQRLLHVLVIYWAVLTSSARSFTLRKSWD